MSEGFANPIIGGGGTLVYPAIKSPNFNQAAQTGWAIMKNGQAFFYDVTVSGQYVGQNFIVNSLGMFFYSVNVGNGANGANALTYSINASSASVLDPYNNKALPGTTQYLFIPSGGAAGYYAFNTIDGDTTLWSNASSQSSWSNDVGITNVQWNGAAGALVSTLFQIAFGAQVGTSLSVGTSITAGTTITATDEISGESFSAVTDNLTVPNGVPATGFTLWADFEGNPVVTTQNGFFGTVTLTQTDVSTNTLGNSTTATDLTIGWAPGANDGGMNTTYDIEFMFNGTWEGQQLQLGLMLNGTFIDVVPIGATAFTTGDTFTGTFRLRVRIITSGSSGTINIEGMGVAQDGTATRVPSTSITLCGQIMGHAYNTTVTNTMAVAAKWGATAVGQTVSGYGSSFTRTGQ